MKNSEMHVIFAYGTGEKDKHCPIKEGHRLLKQPRGVRLAADDSLLVADFGGHCVLRFGARDTCGKVIAGEPGKALVDPDPLKDIDRPLGPADGEGVRLKRPVDAHDGHGGVLVLDVEAGRVQCFGVGHGTAPTVLPMQGRQRKASAHSAEALKNPRSLTLEQCGSVVLCDTWSHRVLRFAAETPGDRSTTVTLRQEEPEVLAGTSNSCGNRADQLCFPSYAILMQTGVFWCPTRITTECNASCQATRRH
jgi:hypothetical protein